MAGRRTYGDPCGVARALDIVGERWALLVVRELLLGPKRFTDLRAGLPHVGPDVLSQRLRDLELAGVLQRRKLPPPASSRVYELTAWGRQLEPVILALGRWGSRAPLPLDTPLLGADSTIIALRTLFDARAADGLSATYELRLADDCFRVRVAGGRMDIARGGAQDADATLETDTDTLSAVLWQGRPLDEALRSADLKLDGSRRAARRFLKLFPPPVPAEGRGA
jgi:DNA-binding HxlR family transcriptional regulator